MILYQSIETVPYDSTTCVSCTVLCDFDTQHATGQFEPLHVGYLILSLIIVEAASTAPAYHVFHRSDTDFHTTWNGDVLVYLNAALAPSSGGCLSNSTRCTRRTPRPYDR